MVYKTTAPTPDNPGRWVVGKWGGPSVLTWQPFGDDQGKSLDKYRLNYLPSKVPGDLVLVRVIVGGIGGTDIIQRVGGYPNAKCEEPGFSPGYDFVGEIEALGPDAEAAFVKDTGDESATLDVGDRIASLCVIGAYATHVLLPASELIKIAHDDDVIKVAALPLNYMTAYGMLRRSGIDLKAGDTILIGSASGGVGTAMAQLVKAFDMQLDMIGTCSVSKFDHVHALGVAPVDRKDPDMVDKVLALTLNGKGVAVAYDCVGSAESLNASKACSIKDAGEVVAIGLMDEVLPDGSGLRQPGVSAIDIVGPRLGAIMPRAQFWGVERDYYQGTKQLYRKDFADILAKVRSGDLDPVIGKMFRLEDAVKVHEVLTTGTGVVGKMVFLVDAELAKDKGLYI